MVVASPDFRLSRPIGEPGHAFSKALSVFPCPLGTRCYEPE
jgi:hypothetical protein